MHSCLLKIVGERQNTNLVQLRIVGSSGHSTTTTTTTTTTTRATTTRATTTTTTYRIVIRRWCFTFCKSNFCSKTNVGLFNSRPPQIPIVGRLSEVGLGFHLPVIPCHTEFLRVPPKGIARKYGLLKGCLGDNDGWHVKKLALFPGVCCFSGFPKFLVDSIGRWNLFDFVDDLVL